MSRITTDRYVAAMRAEGCRLDPIPGWQNTDRPGPWDPHGIIVHHTGPGSTAGLRTLLRKGRSDLPGPLCHAGGEPDGTIDLVGWEDANHAGNGDGLVLAAVLRDVEPPDPRLHHDDTDGNGAFYGLELMHPGDLSAFPPVQVEAAVRYCAALCRAHGWTANSVVYHKGWTRRKVDPSRSFPSITEFRKRVADRLAHPAGWSPGDRPTRSDPPPRSTSSPPRPHVVPPRKDDPVDLTDKIPMPAAYLSTQATGDDDPTVEAVLRRTYEWAYRACQAAEEAAALARAQAK